MLCEKCNKRPATVHLTEISYNNVKKTVHLCEECVQETALPFKAQFSLPEVLGSLLEPMMDKMFKEVVDVKCPHCGMTYPMLHKKARFGCAQDYELFKKGIIPILKKIHGSTQHTGKTPQEVSPDVLRKSKELKELQRKLEQLVKAEEFEKAAEVRDEIKRLRDEKKR